MGDFDEIVRIVFNLIGLGHCPPHLPVGIFSPPERRVEDGQPPPVAFPSGKDVFAV